MAEWTANEAEVATRLRAKGYSNIKIGRMIGKSRHSVQSWFKRRESPTFGSGCDKWTKDEEARLVELRESGVRAHIIAKELDRSYRSIVGKLKRMGVTDSYAVSKPVQAIADGDREHVRLLLAYYAKRERMAA
jgi:predicted transcriptional regulator